MDTLGGRHPRYPLLVKVMQSWFGQYFDLDRMELRPTSLNCRLTVHEDGAIDTAGNHAIDTAGNQ